MNTIKSFTTALLISSLLSMVGVADAAEATATPAADAMSATRAEKPKSTADHSRFKELQKEFASGPEVTEACLECHNDAAKQIHTTKHWNWEYISPKTGQKLGKKNVINNFCTATRTNLEFCASCHIGYDYRDESFDFTSERNVDCLVCHDSTGTYKKYPGLAGHPAYEPYEWPAHSGTFKPAVDLQKVAQNVGQTSRETCGACHFNGGGGNAVKHGDLDKSLEKPGNYLDVHMDAKGLNFSCSTCHADGEHDVAGSRYHTQPSEKEGLLMRGKYGDRNPATCQACHGNSPHPKSQERLNTHTRKLACQTCHIPEYARGQHYTKMTWDWSTAGKLDENGHPIKINASSGKVAYDSKKGDFTYDRYVKPEYKWYNGEVEFTLFGDEVNPDEVVKINDFKGGPNDPGARIWPFKVFRGKQPIDAEKKSLAVFHTAGDDDSAFWTNFNWEKALTTGMAAMGTEYSGKLDFVSTEMSWPITHMVAPKEDALTCAQCHNENGRMKGIEGVYMPGTNNTPMLDKLAFIIALLSLIGVLIHGGIRIIASRKGG
jgi:octaheme c-type cytochrome (tetrathionate reductase family)